jgi:hypothetical protein
MATEFVRNAVVIGATLAAGALLLHPRLRASRDWRATITPLASIIGSGFLVLAPLLLRHFGALAGWVMAGLCATAYAVGHAVRCNIRSIDRSGAASGLIGALETASSWALAFAYVVSVAYYLNLFGAFALTTTPWHGQLPARVLTTAMLAAVAALGLWRGLAGLERAETFSVGLKLAVIVGLLAGLGLVVATRDSAPPAAVPEPMAPWDALRLAFGMVVTVQGFETSRYLRGAYDAATRVRTMRRAQWLASAIYVAYIGLAAMLFDPATVPASETAIIPLMAVVASGLPALLVLAALSAQFSAAVADTGGCGGLVQELSRQRVPARAAYAALAVLGIALTWWADVFEIISHASRAFAAYYALQCLIAALRGWQEGARARAAAHGALALVMALAAVLGIPAG